MLFLKRIARSIVMSNYVMVYECCQDVKNLAINSVYDNDCNCLFKRNGKWFWKLLQWTVKDQKPVVWNVFHSTLCRIRMQSLRVTSWNIKANPFWRITLSAQTCKPPLSNDLVYTTDGVCHLPSRPLTFIWCIHFNKNQPIMFLKLRSSVRFKFLCSQTQAILSA